ncbi:MAG: hypothetical protein GF331_02780 [Chitinivibrionales bacterium]|nr:hypothetical protein [Chitinivibrionales bacterium]
MTTRIFSREAGGATGAHRDTRILQQAWWAALDHTWKERRDRLLGFADRAWESGRTLARGYARDYCEQLVGFIAMSRVRTLEQVNAERPEGAPPYRLSVGDVLFNRQKYPGGTNRLRLFIYCGVVKDKGQEQVRLRFGNHHRDICLVPATVFVRQLRSGAMVLVRPDHDALAQSAEDESDENAGQQQSAKSGSAGPPNAAEVHRTASGTRTAGARESKLSRQASTVEQMRSMLGTGTDADQTDETVEGVDTREIGDTSELPPWRADDVVGDAWVRKMLLAGLLALCALGFIIFLLIEWSGQVQNTHPVRPHVAMVCPDPVRLQTDDAQQEGAGGLGPWGDSGHGEEPGTCSNDSGGQCEVVSAGFKHSGGFG